MSVIYPGQADRAKPSSPADMPIAVIGIGCRFAGKIDSAEAMWRVLAEGRDVVTEVPPHRWDLDAVYDPQPGVAGKTQSRWGGFLDDVAGFEPEFFGLADREAELIDPQFRMLLETGCEALEHAGYPPHGLRGSATAVIVGCAYEDYMYMMDFDRLLRHPDAAHSIIGNAGFTASSRIAYLLDLRGPAVTLDTACSSALVAVHLAAQALRTGEADLALAGGAMLSLLANGPLVFSAMGVLSQGRSCRAFDADGDGYVRGEGCGMVALKRLDDALDAGDQVLAVLRGTGVNNNGRRSETMISPSVAGQQELVTQVLDRAGVDPARVALIETHGPGTPVGDPVEYASLRAGYGADGVRCALGSVKTNIGHCETASGIAGLIKAVLAVQHGQIPANLHFAEWNPEIDPRGARFYVPTTLTPWPQTGGSRLAAVCSYGMSGTNAHAVVEQAPDQMYRCDPEDAADDDDRVRLYPLSAGSEQALAATAGRVAGWLADAGTAVPLRDVSYTLTHRREHRRSRAVLVAGGRTELIERLRRLAEGQPDPATWTGLASSTGPHQRGPVWVFSAQGSQWAAMGRELLAAEPAFAEVVAEIEPLVHAESGFSVREEMTASEVVTGVARVQPTLFTMQVALAAAWRARGVAPGAVIGHSMGEVAAAVVAGGLSLADGVKVICRRSRLCTQLAGRGTMALVGLPPDQVDTELAAAGVTDVSVAAISAPASTVISGPVAQLEALVAAWQQREIVAALIAVDYPSHHALVDPILPDIRECLADLTPHQPSVPFYSTALEDPNATPTFDAVYWANNLRRPVRFGSACAAALADGHRAFIEISPHPVQLPAVRENALHAGREATVLPTLTRGQVDSTGLLPQAAAAHCAGIALSWPTDAEGELAEVPLPVWARRPLWIPEAMMKREYGGPDNPDSQHGRPLLGPHVRLPGGLDEQHVWQADLGTAVYPWLADHRVYGAPAMPGAGYIEMVLAAAADVFGDTTPCEIRDLTFHALLRLDPHTTVTTRATGQTEDTVTVDILAESDGQPRCVASAVLHRLAAAPIRPSVEVSGLLAGQQSRASAEPVFASARRKRVEHGPDFVGITAMYPPDSDPKRVVGRIEIPRGLRADAAGFRLHPVLLDGCMQTLCAHPAVMTPPTTLLPLHIGTVRVLTDHAACWCVAQVHDADDNAARADLTLLAEDGGVVAELLDTHLGHAAGDPADSHLNQRLLEVQWQAAPLPPPADPNAARGCWLLVTEDESPDDPLPQALVEALKTAGADCVRSDLTLSAAVSDTVSEYLSNGDYRGLIMLCPAPVAEQTLATIDQARDRVQRLIDIVRVLVDTGTQTLPRLHVLTRGAQLVPGFAGGTLEQSPLRGLCRVIGGEHPELGTTHTDLAAHAETAAVAAATAAEVVDELLADSAEDETAWRDGARYVARLRPAPFRDTERHSTEVRFGHDSVAPALRHGGALDSLELLTRRRPGPGARQVEIRVHAAGLNPGDMLNALGNLPGDQGSAPLGLDCAGEITAVGADVTDLRVGDRVAAFAPGALGSFVLASAVTVFGIPTEMSYADAATLPTAALTARYSLHHLARVRAGEHVLIHSGSGGLGQAAIALAAQEGAVIHATAGTEAERKQLCAMGIANIYDSRGLAFAEQIRAATNGRGVDVVLNSLTGSALRVSLDLLCPGGRFIELSRSDIDADHHLGLSPFRRNITFASVDLTLIAEKLPDLASELTREVSEELSTGRLTPMAYTSCPLEKLTDALRTMAAAEHTGTLVVTMPLDGTAPAVIPPEQVPIARRDGAYLITGGLGGLGLLLARDLAEQGAGRIVLNGRSRPSPTATNVIEDLRLGGTDIAVELGDIADAATASRLITAATATGLPLRGIAHAAASVIDATLTRIDDDVLDQVWAAKTVGAWRLHHASLEQPVDWWLGFSSAATLIGNPGQGAYAAANGWLDAFTTYRRANGHPAHTVQWGAWAEHGRGTALIERGLTMIKPAEGVAACQAILRHNRAHTAYLPPHDAQRLIGDRLSTIPFFATLAIRTHTKADTAGEQHTKLRAELHAADPATRQTLLTNFVLDHLATVLRRNRAALDPDSPLTDTGLDSLMAVELRTHIHTALDIQIPPKAIWKHATAAALATHLANQFGG